MNAPVSSRRRHGALLIWSGGVAMVLMGAFALAWWKLPEWQPKWVIEHSPWADPAVRAMIHYGAIDYSFPPDHVMDWGAGIGPPLRRQYEVGSPHVREQVLVLAAATLSSYGGGGFSIFGGRPRRRSASMQPGQLFRPRPDGRRLTISEEDALCADLRWLVITASKEASDVLRARMLPLIAAVRDPDLLQLPCDWLLSGTSGIDAAELFGTIKEIRDPRSVPRLIPLLSTTPESSAREWLTSALRQCLVTSQVAEVLNATRHPNRYVREWAASVIDLVNADQALGTQLIGLLSDPESDVRLTALNTVIRKGIPNEFQSAVIARLEDQTQEIRRIAVDAIITQKVPPVFRSAFIALVSDPAADLRLVVIEAIGELRMREAGDILLARLKDEPVLSLRMSIIEALGRLEHIDAKPVLRQIAVLPTDPLRGAAIVALGTLRDPTDFPLLMNLLRDENDDIVRKARIALGYLPLTPEQQKQVDALWEAETQNP